MSGVIDMVEAVATAPCAPGGEACLEGHGGDPGEGLGVAGADVAEEGRPHSPAPSRAREGEKAAPKRRRKAKRRMVRWSAAREGKFLEALGQTGNVKEAVRASGLSDTSVYRRRRASEEFRARWAVALREGFARLEALMLERALAGVEKAVWHGGRQVGTIHEYDNRLCLALLSAHRGTVTGATPMAADMSEAAMRLAVEARLSEMNRRMGGEG